MNSPHLWPLAFIPFLVFVAMVITGSSNAVNLTDGLDGLAIGCTVIAAGALTVLTYVSSNFRWATYLEIQYIPVSANSPSSAARWSARRLGFLWYNAHPAEVFMGDVGSLRSAALSAPSPSSSSRKCCSFSSAESSSSKRSP